MSPDDEMCSTCGAKPNEVPTSPQFESSEIPDAYVTPIPPKKSNNRSKVVIAVIAVLVAVVAFGSHTASKAKTVTVHVQLLLTDFDTHQAGCMFGVGGYSDISEGMSALLTDENGNTLGASTMQFSNVTGALDPDKGPNTCGYYANFNDVPMDKQFYSVELGDGHRGKVTNSLADMMANAVDENTWQVKLTLGN